ncbi:YqaJ viral recombinase family protein [Nocardia farcinica]|uniref:YqaJ viral recombinase family protein n=1 Tax=Nocardia farcinica TaxID=37329 RepID=UPI0034174F95
MTGAVQIEPGSAEWLALITPSKVAAILGISRYESPYRLWHRMKGLVAPEPPADRFDVGHAMELALAELWRIQNPGWQLSPGPVQLRRDFGPFESVATLDRRARRGKLRRCVEFKTARKLEEWGDFGTDQAPTDYVVQAIWQMFVSGYTQLPAHLLVMGPYFQHHTYEIPFDAEVALATLDRVRAFAELLKADTPPPLDDSVATYECVRALHPDLVEGAVDLDVDEAVEYLRATHAAKAADKRLLTAKIRISHAMGNATTALANGEHVASRRRQGKSIALVAATKTSIEAITKESIPA